MLLQIPKADSNGGTCKPFHKFYLPALEEKVCFRFSNCPPRFLIVFSQHVSLYHKHHKLYEVPELCADAISALCSSAFPSSLPQVKTIHILCLGLRLRWLRNRKVLSSVHSNLHGAADLPLGTCQLHTLKLQTGVKFSHL